MKKIYRVFAIMILLSISTTAKSQNDGIALTLLPHLSYNNYYNPGIPIESNVVFGVGISNIGMSVYNSSIKYNNMYNFENNVPVAFNANKLINSLNEYDNFISTDFSLDMFRLGLRFGNLFVDANMRVRSNSELHYSRDFLGFFINGNGNYMGYDNPANFSIGTDLNIFTEVSLGLQYTIAKKFTIGVRPKLLCGTANISINGDNSKIYTDKNTYSMTADVNINMKAATILNSNAQRLSELTGLINLDSLNINELINLEENYGFGIDFGASYIGESFGIAAGVYDLGYINWSNSKEKQINKDNVVVNDALIDNYEDVLNMELNFNDLYQDFLENVWDNDSIYVGEDYQTTLKTRIMLQGYYELLPMARFSAIAQMYYVKKEFHPALTLAYSGSFFKFLNITANYTFSKYSGNSVGAGISLNLGPLNIYAVTDNIMILTRLNASTAELVTTYDAVNARLGLVFTFGKVTK